MSSPVLELVKVSRSFRQAGGEIAVLKNVNVELQAGTVAALVGPSGSGKTTLLQIAGLLESPSAGRVVLCGEEMSKAGDRTRTLARRTHIGFVYQFHHLLPEFTALENVMLPMLIAGKAKAKAAARAGELLAAMGLNARASHRPAEMSGGEQQRVAIARAVANAPKLLLADEPTGNLDAATAEEVFGFLMKMAREEGVAALVATHNLELAGRMGRTLRLQAGSLASG